MGHFSSYYRSPSKPHNLWTSTQEVYQPTEWFNPKDKIPEILEDVLEKLETMHNQASNEFKKSKASYYEGSMDALDEAITMIKQMMNNTAQGGKK